MTLRIPGVAVVGLTALMMACSKPAPSAPTPQPGPGPGAPNQTPEITAAITPDTGIDDLTTFTARVEVKDADGDRVTLTASGLCDTFPRDTPIELNAGVALITFKTTWKCGPSLRLTATDTRGSSTSKDVSATHKGLGGNLKLVLGQGFYDQPTYWVNLTHTGTAVTGTIRDSFNGGAIDPQEPGTVDEAGRFRLRFKFPSDPDDLVIAGQLTAPRGGLLETNVIASGQVVGRRHGGRIFQLWHEASY